MSRTVEQCHRCGATLGAPDRVSFWYMYDNHAFARLRGATLDEILAHAEQIVNDAGGDSGMVCGAILLRDDSEVRRVRAHIHIHSKWGNHPEWKKQVAEWRRAHEADPDALRLLREAAR